MMRNMLAAWFASTLLSLCATGQAAELAIVNARIYPSPEARPIERGTVLVRDGRIVAVGKGVRVPKTAEVVDAHDAVVTAGFWNSHVHLLPLPLRAAATRTPAELDAALRQWFTGWGFTSVFDIASFPSGNSATLRRRIEAGEVTGPSILTTDVPFFPHRGTPVYVKDLLDSLGVSSAEVATADEARMRIRRQLDDGADGAKLFIGAIVGGDTGVRLMDVDVATAVVEEAHRANKPVFAHPTTVEGVQVGIASGVDVLAHTTPEAGPWSQALVQRLVREGIAITPTLALFEIEVKRDKQPDEVVRKFVATAQQQLRAFAQAGGHVLFGTDVGYIDEADPRREYQLMADAGLDWRQVLASLTTRPAQRFGQGAHKGRIAAGMDADLVVLGADPARDPSAFADVRYTIRNGKVIHRAQ